MDKKIKDYLIGPAIVGGVVVVGTSILTPMLGFVPAVFTVATLNMTTLVAATISAIGGALAAKAVTEKI